MASRRFGGRGRNALTASVSIVPRERKLGTQQKSKDERWQHDAWQHYHDLGEVRFAARYVGNSLSRCRFFVGTRDHPGDPIVPIADDAPPADMAIRDVLDRIRGRDGTFTSLVKVYGIQQFVAGESFLVAEDGLEGERWEFLSTSELSALDKEGSYGRKSDPGGDAVQIGDNSLVVRFWQRDPEFRLRADSPMRSVLDVCDSLRTAQAMQTAGDRSRLATAGLYFVPSEADLPKAPGSTENGQRGRLQLLDDMLDMMSAAMDDPGSAAAIVPIMLEVKADYIEKFKRATFEREVDKTIVERIDHLLQRLAQGLDLPVEKLLGVGDVNHWCLSEDTDILTWDGWRRHDAIGPGTVVLTLNHDTGESEWQPVGEVARFDVTDLPMLATESRSHSSLSTAQHRWPIVKAGEHVAGSRRRWTTSEEGFAAADRVPIAAHCADLPTEPKFTDDFVRLAAAYTSDGTLHRPGRGRRTAHITKFDGDEIEAVRALLTRLLGPAHSGRADQAGTWGESVHKPTGHAPASGIRFHLAAEITAELLAVTGDGKALTLDFARALTEAQIGVLFEAMIDIGDGVRRGPSLQFHQADPARLDALEFLAVMSGRSVTRGTRNALGGYNVRPIHLLTVGSRRTFSPYAATQEWVPYTGVVWCPTTPNRTWFARRNGRSFFTGNTAWQVSEETIQAHIAPMAAAFCEDLGVGFLRPTLELLKVQDLDRYALGFDTTDLVLAPDRADHAFSLWDRFLLSGEATVLAVGFDPSQMPDDDEIARRNAITKAGAPAPFPAPTPEPATDPNRTEDPNADQSDAPPAEQQRGNRGAPDAGLPDADQANAAAVRTGATWALAGRMAGACDMAMERAMERAGARIRTKAVRASTEVADLVAGKESSILAALLGPVQVERLGFTDDALLVEAWDGLLQRLTAWTASPITAQRVVYGVDLLARRRLYDPALDVLGAVTVLCEAALGLGADLAA